MSELFDFLLPKTNGYMLGGGGGGAPVPWGRRQWVGINFCHTKVVKLQQQCHMQNTIFDLPQTTGSIHFFWERECQYPGDSNRRI